MQGFGNLASLQGPELMLRSHEILRVLAMLLAMLLERCMRRCVRVTMNADCACTRVPVPALVNADCEC